MRFITIALIASTLLLSACKERTPEPQPEPVKTIQPTAISSLVNTDLTALTGDSATAATLGIAQARGETLAADASPAWTAHKVLGYNDRTFLVLADSKQPMTLMVEETTGSSVRWSRTLTFDAAWSIASVQLGSRDGISHPILVIDLIHPKGDGAATSRFYLALTTSSGLLFRTATGDKQLANRRVLNDHPQLVLNRADIGNSDKAVKLAALLSLAQNDAAAARGSAKVQSHLDRLASGTDLWLAEGAAEVLTLPTK